MSWRTSNPAGFPVDAAAHRFDSARARPLAQNWPRARSPWQKWPMGADAAETAGGYDVVEASIGTLAADMAAGRVTSEALVLAYQARIAAVDRAGPQLRSVIGLNQRALDDARTLDAERAVGKLRGPLHGVPLLIKDNIETDDGTATTAGSLALKDNVTLRDAPVVRRLKDAGAVVLGKANLSEWANIPLRPLDQRLVGRRRAGQEPLRPRSQRLRFLVGNRRGHCCVAGRGRRRH